MLKTIISVNCVLKYFALGGRIPLKTAGTQNVEKANMWLCIHLVAMSPVVNDIIVKFKI